MLGRASCLAWPFVGTESRQVDAQNATLMLLRRFPSDLLALGSR